MSAFSFVIDLTDKVSAPAAKSAKGLSEAAKAAKVLKGEMESVSAQMVKAKALGDTSRVTKLTTEFGKYKSALSAIGPVNDNSGESGKRLSEAMSKVHNAVLTAVAGISGAFGALKAGDAQGVVENLTQSFAGLAKLLDLVVPGLGAAAGAIIQVFGAIAGATVGLIQAGAELALQQTELKNKLTATFEALGGAPGAGKATLTMLNDLSDRLGVTRASLVETTKQFEAMGITDLGELRNQVSATAAITSVMGESGAAAYAKIISKTHEAIAAGGKFKISDKQIAGFKAMGLNVEDVASKMGVTAKELRTGLTTGTISAQKFQDALTGVASSKFGGPLEEQALSLGNAWAKLKENVGHLFEDVDVKPFLESMRQLLSIFSQSKPSGQAMKAGLTSVFDSVFSAAAKVANFLEGFFLNVEIWVLKALVFLKPFVKKFDELNEKFGIVSKFIFGVKLLATVIGVGLAGAFAVLVAPMAIFWGGILAVVAGISLLAGAIVDIIPTATSALAGWATSAYDAATSFIDGLVNGIEAGITRVVDAAKNLGTSAMGAIKGILGIHSPSRVMMQMGIHTGAGFAGGLNASRQAVASASAGMASSSALGVTSGASPAMSPQSYSSGSSGGTSKHVVVNVGGIKIDGAGKSAEGITEELVSLVFERIALSEGL